MLPKAVSKKRNEKDFIDQGLKEIYNSERHLDFARLEHKKSGLMGKFLMILVIFLGLALTISWLIFFGFGRTEKFGGAGINLFFDGPKEVVSGESADYILRYENNENLALGEATFEIKVPKEFSLQFSDPALDADNILRFGAIPRGGKGEIKLHGTILGTIGQSLIWQAILNYRPENFNADFEKVATSPSIIKDSIIGIGAEGPDKVIPGEDLEYKIVFQNKNENEVFGVEIRATYPEGFIFKDASTAPTQGTNLWTVGKVAGKSQSSFLLHGAFANDASGAREMRFEIGVKDGAYLKQAEALLETEVAVGGLALNLSLGDSSSNHAVNFGDELKYVLNYKNQGTDVLKDVEIHLKLDSPTVFGGKTPLMFETARPDPKVVVRDGEMLWDKRIISKLATLMPGDEGMVSVSVKLINGPFQSAEIKDYKIGATASAKIGKFGNLSKGLTIQNAPFVSSILTDAILTAFVRYYDAAGGILGEGPLPPKVGETTKFRVFWELTNSLHEISGIEVVTVLPLGVEFTGKTEVDAGDLSYDVGSRRVLWKLNRLPLAVPRAGISFEVSLTPSSGDLGKILPLTGETTLSAKDTFNGGQINRVAPAMNTNLAGDAEGAGRGRVGN